MASTSIAIAVEKSHNAKIGIASATYASQVTCPDTCIHYGKDCYAEEKLVGFTTRKLNTAAVDASGDDVAVEEAAAIATLTGKLPLRVHVVGDAASNFAASLLGTAMVQHTAKHGQSAWTYTHAWRTIDRTSWNGASVLASCDTAEEVLEATSRGYATAIVVDSHASTKRYTTADGTDVIPCPQQTGKAADCVSCGLCLKARRVGAPSIAFANHSARIGK